MGYSVRLTDPITKETIEFDNPHQMKGGTYAMGGTTEAWLSITYNYSRLFQKALGDIGLDVIYGKTGAEAIQILKDGAKKLNDDVDNDYWKSTEGNVKRVLLQLIAMSEMRPDGIWDIGD